MKCYKGSILTVNKNNDWKAFLKTNLIIIIVYSIILTGILIFIPLIYPIINNQFGENIGDIFEEILQNIYNERRKVSSRTIENNYNNGNIQLKVKDEKYCYFMDGDNDDKCNC